MTQDKGGNDPYKIPYNRRSNTLVLDDVMDNLCKMFHKLNELCHLDIIHRTWWVLGNETNNVMERAQAIDATYMPFC